MGDYRETIIAIAVINDGATICNTGEYPIYVNKGKSIYDFLDNMSKVDSSIDVPATIAKLKSLEITKEEFDNLK